MKKAFALFVIIALCISILCACVGGSSSSRGSTSKCTICKKTATHTFQGSGYCDKHYQDAVEWAFDNVSGKN